MDAVQRKLDEMNRRIDGAVKVSDTALQTISAHEKLCEERYKNIETTGKVTVAAIDEHTRRSSTNFQTIFTEVGKLQKLVYIGVGIWVGMPVIAAAIFGIIELIRYFHG